MAYNVLKGKVDFSGPANGSIENIVDDHSSQTINGVKTFSSTVSASAFYDTTSGAPVTPPAIVTVDTDGNNRVITSNGDGTATAEAGMTFSAGILSVTTSISSSVISGSANGLYDIPNDQFASAISASFIELGDGIEGVDNKVTAKADNGILVGASGIAVSAKTNGGLDVGASGVEVDPDNAVSVGSVTTNDTILIKANLDSTLKKTTINSLKNYMQAQLPHLSLGGATGNLQYHNGSDLAGSTNLSWNSATNSLSVTGSLKVNGSLSLSIANISSSPYVVSDTDHTILCNTAMLHITASLPSASVSQGKVYTLKKINGANELRIESVGGNIDFQSFLVLTENASFRTIQSDGTEWYVIGANGS